MDFSQHDLPQQESRETREIRLFPGSALHLPPAQHESRLSRERDFVLQRDPPMQHLSSPQRSLQQLSNDRRGWDFELTPPQQLRPHAETED